MAALRATSPRAVLVAGALAVGVLDILDAFVFFWLRNAVPPVRILQSIAAGVLGPASFEAGAASAALGLVLHFIIACGIVLTFYAAARALVFLRRRPLLLGAAYGVVVYCVMNIVVVPLSAASAGIRLPALPVLLNSVLIHIFGVGIPAVWFAQRAVHADPENGRESIRKR